MLNKIVIMGRLPHTPELKHTASGMTYCNFSLAVERDFKDKQSGEKVTDWIDFIAWSHTAEFICQYFAKGRMMVAAGRLQTESYTDKDGNKRKSVEIVVENAYFGDSKRDQNGQNGQNGQGGGEQTASGSQFVEITEGDDELPFI